MSMYSLLDDGTARQKLQVSLNVEQATNLIIERAKQLVNQCVEQRGHDTPPFLSEEFARLQGIKKIEKADLGETSAVLLRFHDGYVIKVNQNHPPVRQNFSCAHEIGHTLFSELKLERYIQSIEYRTSNPQGQMMARPKAREHLCDAAATELLMPELIFKKYLSNFGLSVSSIEHLANVFRVSIQAAAIRIAEISVEPCITLLWQLQPRTKSKLLKLAWCIGPGIKLLGKAHYMPVHIVAKSDSTLYKAYQYDSPIKSWKKFKVDDTAKRLLMESKGFGHDEARYVISLAFLNR